MIELLPPLRLFSAGSLRSALPGIVANLDAHPPADMLFGPAGLLREQIEAGDVPDMYLSANLDHPAALSATRPWSKVQPFARNAFVAVARRGFGLTGGNFLDRLLAEGVRIGTSTPGADPSGDYAQMLFARADAIRPGIGVMLASRAVHLVGGRSSATLPEGRSPAEFYLGSAQVEVFLSYRSGAAALAGAFDVIEPPDDLRVEAEYGLIVLATEPNRRRAAEALAAEVLSPRGQAMLAAKGFTPIA